MNQVQETYAIAKANYEAADQEACDYMKAFDWMLDTDDEEMIEIYTDLECNKRENLNTLELRLAVKEAETALLIWSRRKAESIAFLNEKSAIATAYNAANTNIKIRNQIIETAMNLV